MPASYLCSLSQALLGVPRWRADTHDDLGRGPQAPRLS